jgi:hypothetical protein
MKLRTVKYKLAALLMALGSAQSAFAESPGALGKEWSKSGFGSNVTYKCKQTSCGGPKSRFFTDRFGGIGAVPELGIPSGSNVEAEFRRRPEVRRILAAMLQQVTRQSGSKGSSISTSYFANADNVGFNFTLFDSGQKLHMAAQLRISDNKAIMIASTAETAAMARRNFNLILPTLKAD